MKYFWFILKTSLEDFRRNKLRTILTSLGILIGISSVVLIIAFGLGLKKYIQDQFESMGTNVVYIFPGNIVEDGSLNMSGPMSALFDDRDLKSLEKIEKAKYIEPFFVRISKIEGNGNTASYEVAGGTEITFEIMNLEAEYGKLYTKSDVRKGSKKAVLGPNVAKKIFDTPQNAIGKTVKISNLAFTVLGVVKSKGGGGLGMPSVDDEIYVPLKSLSSFNPDNKYITIYIQAENQEDIADIKIQAEEILLKRYEEDEFSVAEQTEFLNAINSIFTILNAILVAIAAISLIVGGIGIMNIMFVSVVERIREIGIRRAVGARKSDILYLFLTEAVLLSVFGGLLALIISWTIVILVQKYFPAYIDLTTVLIALIVSSGVGIIFGVAPAKKASDLSPIEAIRYE